MIKMRFGGFDNGGEYFSNRLQIYLVDDVIELQTARVYIPKQNGVGECKQQQTFFRSDSFLLLDMDVPKFLRLK